MCTIKFCHLSQIRTKAAMGNDQSPRCLPSTPLFTTNLRTLTLVCLGRKDQSYQGHMHYKCSTPELTNTIALRRFSFTVSIS